MKRLLFIATVSAALITGAWWFFGVLPSGAPPATVMLKPVRTPVALADLPPDADAQVLADRIHRLGRDVSAEEQRAFADWMAGPKPEKTPRRLWHWLSNEAMDALCHQNHSLPDLSDRLIAMARTAPDPVLRDYAIQHLADLLQPVQAGEPFECNPAQRQKIVDALLVAARQETETYSATAVLALQTGLLNGRKAGTEKDAQPAITHEQLRTLTLTLVRSDKTDFRVRITALQICANHDLADALPVARALAADARARVALRLSAIAAIGALGSKQDLALLNDLQSQQQKRLQAAILPAIEKLQAKN